MARLRGLLTRSKASNPGEGHGQLKGSNEVIRPRLSRMPIPLRYGPNHARVSSAATARGAKVVQILELVSQHTTERRRPDLR